uniref:RING-type domain-containing protein n=1 Tax=Oryza meridionalis TaxID=40149 RepID=A0A0E0ES32_9ORYZ
MAMEAGAPRGAAATTSGGAGGAPEAGAEPGRRGAPVTWGRVWRAGQEAAAHALLLCFTALLALKLDGLFRGSWWMCGALMPGHGETMTDEAIWERLPGTPSNAKFFPLRAVFLPILLLQVTTVSFAIWIFFERLVTKLRAKKITDGYISFSSKIDELFMMMQHGSRLIAWWSIDEDSKEEQAHLCYANNSGYSTFCSYPPEMVQRLQLALGEQTKMAKLSQQQCDKLKNEQILCRICFERDICIVLLPCRHYVLCEACSDKCQSCPICRF